MKTLVYLLICTLFFGCVKDNSTSHNLTFNDTIILPYGQIFHNNDNNTSIYLDSVLYDERCPIGFNCVWEGNAKVRFKFIANHSVNNLVLNTFREFKTDSILCGYKISLISLTPYPRSGVKTDQKEYKATLIISH